MMGEVRFGYLKAATFEAVDNALDDMAGYTAGLEQQIDELKKRLERLENAGVRY